MSRDVKTDNQFLPHKLSLRRYFLDKYHSRGELRVFDACQGAGTIWNHLKSEIKIASYWGVDRKKKPGRVQIDSVRILIQPGWNFNVVDVDVYGSPWKHWAALLPNISEPTTVFLTIGHTRKGGGGADYFSLCALGCDFPTLQVPGSIAIKIIIERALPYDLALARQHGLSIVEAAEIFPQLRTVRYIGVHLRPACSEGTRTT